VSFIQVLGKHYITSKRPRLNDTKPFPYTQGVSIRNNVSTIHSEWTRKEKKLRNEKTL